MVDQRTLHVLTHSFPTIRSSALYQKDVRFFEFNIAALGVSQSFVVIVDRHRENHLGPILTDDILVEEFANLAGSWIARTPQQVSFCELLAQGCGAKVDAFAANEDARPCDEVADFRL